MRTMRAKAKQVNELLKHHHILEWFRYPLRPQIPGNFPHYEDHESCIVHDYTDVRFLEIVANRLERSRLTNCSVAYIYVNQ